jgi:hypothetical protein
MPKKLEYDYVKKYIESKGCELLDNEYFGIDYYLNIKFSCGHIGKRKFHNFQYNNPVCFECGQEKYRYEKVKEIVENAGYILLSDKYFDCIKKLDIGDIDGYKYSICFGGFLENVVKKNKKLYVFHSGNIYSNYNLKLFLKINMPNMNLGENEVWTRDNKKMLFFDNNGYKYFICSNSMKEQSKNGNYPERFGIPNPYTIENIKNWLRINKKTFSLVDDQKFNGCHVKLYFKCGICNKDEINFKMSIVDVLSGNGCPICGNRQIGKFNNFKFLYPEISEEWDYELNYPIKPEDVAPHTPNKFWWICPECDVPYLSSLCKRNDLKDPRGCPNCRESHLEKKIKTILNKYNIKYEPQKRFKNCRNVFPLPFDFFLNDHNFLIEAQGQQHYKPVSRFGGEKQFDIQKIRDKIKYDYCKNNNIKLIEIPYWEFENIELILTKELNLTL